VNLQNLSIGRRLSLAFASVIGIFLLVGWAALHTASNLAEAEKWNDHTHAVLTTGEGMLSSSAHMPVAEIRATQPQLKPFKGPDLRRPVGLPNAKPITAKRVASMPMSLPKPAFGATKKAKPTGGDDAWERF
jgi:hypothetical protein